MNNKLRLKYSFVLMFFNIIVIYGQVDSIIAAIPKNKLFKEYLIVKESESFYMIINGKSYINREQKKIEKETNQSYIDIVNNLIDTISLCMMKNQIYDNKNDDFVYYFSDFLLKKVYIVRNDYTYIKYKSHLVFKDLSLCVQSRKFKKPKDYLGKKRNICIIRIPWWNSL